MPTYIIHRQPLPDQKQVKNLYRSKRRGGMFLGGQHQYGDDQCSRDKHLYEHTLGRIYSLLQERARKG